MHRIKYKSIESGGVLIQNGLSVLVKSQKGLPSQVDPLLVVERLVPDVGAAGFSSAAVGRRFFNTGITQSLVKRDIVRVGDIHILFRGRQTTGSLVPHQCNKSHMLPYFARPLASSSASQSSGQNPRQDTLPYGFIALARKRTLTQNRKDISTVEDPFDAPTYNIPEKPVTFTEGASYSLIILAGLGVAAAAGYAVFKELIFEPKEYKIFGKALERVQNDSQVKVRIGSPITGYGQESRNRAARQRIPHRTWTDQDGNEHVEVNFVVRGPHGGGKVYSEMFKDKTDKQWKFTFLIVEITSPSHSQLLLESYVPA